MVGGGGIGFAEHGCSTSRCPSRPVLHNDSPSPCRDPRRHFKRSVRSEALRGLLRLHVQTWDLHGATQLKGDRSSLTEGTQATSIRPTGGKNLVRRSSFGC